MIPKTIHYCWFGGNPLPKSASKCIKSWKKYCPDYEIIRWDESNYDLDSAPLYVQQAYYAKKWAFVTDYVRLQIIYEQGGIYLDTDVELIRKLDTLLNCEAYFGFENEKLIATGLGFGAVKGCWLLAELMEDYNDLPFVLEDGSYDLMPCPDRNTKHFIKHGLKTNNTAQTIENNIKIYPTCYFRPMEGYTRKLHKSKNTYSIHWYDASWWDDEKRKAFEKDLHERRIKRFRYIIRNKPKNLLSNVIGIKNYERIVKTIKRH